MVSVNKDLGAQAVVCLGYPLKVGRLHILSFLLSMILLIFC